MISSHEMLLASRRGLRKTKPSNRHIQNGPSELYVLKARLRCRRRDSNPHASRRHPLKMVCLPIPPLRRGLSRSLLLLRRLLRRGRRGRRGLRSRLLLRLSGRSLTLSRRLLLLLLLRAFPDHGGSAWLRDQNRERQRRDHENDCRSRGRLTQYRAGAAGSECRL